jgi:DNA-binding PadR family transcriptional regulator
MAKTNLTFPTGLVLQAIVRGNRHGFDIIDATGLPSGTVYPALRRLEGAGFLVSAWEAEEEAVGRPARCYYALTPDGMALLEQVIRRFPSIPMSMERGLAGGFGVGGAPKPEGA